jgi:RNA polymerase sigma-70 factor (ECF subfamily)
MQTAVAPAVKDDRDIIEQLRTGQRDRAFEQLMERYEGKIFRLCCALLRNRQRAEDAAQESLVRIWKALERYDGRAALSTWIYAITRNRCLTAIERERATESLTDSDSDGDAELPSRLEQLAASESEPADDRSALLRELIELLPERLRRALVLYYFEERSTVEVATMLGCPEGTVKTHLFRARAALAEQLRRRGLADPQLWLEPER